jgi:cytidine deaminase
MKVLPLTALDTAHQTLLKEATARTAHSLNKVSSPQTSVIIATEKSKYYGNNIFLSNCTLICAEASALAATVAANDTKITTLYLSVRRTDVSAPKLISPCGNCRQMLHDFAHLNGRTIDVYSTTSELEEVMVTSSDELLPEGFKSVSLEKFSQLTS